jgi:hypothetical protein
MGGKGRGGGGGGGEGGEYSLEKEEEVDEMMMSLFGILKRVQRRSREGLMI